MSIGNAIYRLRTEKKLSQEQFANLFGVSRQSVQKWENGTFKPDIDKLIAISRHFGVSVDSLLFDNVNPEMMARVPEPFDNNSEIDQQYGELYGWIPYFNNLEREYKQCEAEGIDLSRYRDVFLSVSKLPVGPIKNRMAELLFQVTMTAPCKPGYKYNEPSRWEEIRSLTQHFELKGGLPEEDVLRERVYGAWLGRCCGVYAGYVIEGAGRKEIRKLLKNSDNYPMRRYILSGDFDEEMSEKLRFIPVDERFADRMRYIRCEDINFTVLSSRIIDVFGRDFKPADVAGAWLSYQPRDSYHGDERIIFRNLICGYYPPDSAVYENPYRESIAAWVRADYYGYINPGDPEAAAGMAWRDACVSNVKNGIYGSMFVAAMLACAAVTDDLREIIRGGLSQIPTTSRLYESITGAIGFYDSGAAQEQFYDDLHRRYNESGETSDWDSIFPNAEIVTAALLYGKGNFGGTVSAAVQAGFDTDCNAAIVGSVLGMRAGVGGIGPEWRAPAEKLIDSNILGVGKVSIAEMADKTMEHIKAAK